VRKALLGTSETAIVGQLLDPETGEAPGFGAPPATAKLFSGDTLLKSDATNESGFYEMTGLRAGTGRTLKATRSGSVKGTLRKGISIVSGQVAGASTDALPQARDTGNATITIDWKTWHPGFRPETPGCVDTCNGWEFDLRVKLPDSNIVEPPAGSLTSAPFAYAPKDSSTLPTSTSDPVETVIIGSQAANGTYKVIANKPPDPSLAGGEWNPSWNGSQASVQMYNGAAPLVGGGLKAVPSTCGTNQFWYVGNLTKSGTFYTWTNKNLCTNTAP
jgi:hypothetical protein